MSKKTIKEQIIEIMMDGRDYTSKELSEMVDSSSSKSDDFYKVVRGEIHAMKEEGIIEVGDYEGTWRLR